MNNSKNKELRLRLRIVGIVWQDQPEASVYIRIDPPILNSRDVGKYIYMEYSSPGEFMPIDIFHLRLLDNVKKDKPSEVVTRFHDSNSFEDVDIETDLLLVEGVGSIHKRDGTCYQIVVLGTAGDYIYPTLADGILDISYNPSDVPNGIDVTDSDFSPSDLFRDDSVSY